MTLPEALLAPEGPYLSLNRVSVQQCHHKGRWGGCKWLLWVRENK